MPAQNSRSSVIRGGWIGAGAFFFRLGAAGAGASGAAGAGASGAAGAGASGAGASGTSGASGVTSGTRDFLARFLFGWVASGSGSAGLIGTGPAGSWATGADVSAGSMAVVSVGSQGCLWFYSPSEKSRVILNAVPCRSSRLPSASLSSRRSRCKDRTPHSM